MKFSIKQLKNGVQLISIPRPSPTTAIFIAIRAGSRDEKNAQAGMAHFIEHMFFKGTKKRPTYLDISKDLDALGADYNAFTSHEITGFFIHQSAPKSVAGAEILFDLFLNNILPEKEIDKEKAVISEEINMYEDMPQAKAMQEFQRLIFSQTSLERPIAGEKATIYTFNQNMLKTFIQHHYLGSNSAIAVAGALPLDTLKSLEEQALLIKPGKNIIPSDNFIFSQKQKGFTKNIDQAHIVMGFPTFGIEDKRRFALGILSSILGGMMSSRLFVEVREKRGWAYYISSSPMLFQGAGYIAIKSGLNQSKLAEGIDAIKNEIKKLNKKSIEEKELKRAKDNFIGQLYLGLEENTELAQFYLSQALRRREILTPDEVVKRVEKITITDIMVLAQEIFDDKKQSLVIVK